MHKRVMFIKISHVTWFYAAMDKAKNTGKFIKNTDYRAKNKVKKGILAENIACRHLNQAGFSILWRNIRLYSAGSKQIGEIDILAERDGFMYVFEVRSMFGKSPALGLGDLYKDLKHFRIRRSVAYLLNLNSGESVIRGVGAGLASKLSKTIGKYKGIRVYIIFITILCDTSQEVTRGTKYGLFIEKV